MPRKNTSESPRATIYQEVTDRVIAMLESGETPPWLRPWGVDGARVPTSGATGGP